MDIILFYFIDNSKKTYEREGEYECNKVVEFDTDYVGADLENYDNIYSWQDCAVLCNQNDDCSKWTWSDSNTYLHHSFKCFLKHGKPATVKKKSFYSSGIKCSTGR